MSLNRYIVADQYYMHSAARVNQFEMKDTSIEFVINVPRQNNSVKIKVTTHQDLSRGFSITH